jgi:hypothetical protein
MKISFTSLILTISWFCSIPMLVGAENSSMVKIIKLNPSASLIVKKITDPVTNTDVALPNLPQGVVPLSASSPLAQQIQETYIVSLRTSDTEVDLDKSVFKVNATARDGVRPMFAVYDAMLEGNILYYFFVNKGNFILATATVDASGAVSNYRRQMLPETITQVEKVHFVEDKNGNVLLKISEAGKKIKLFKLSDSAQAISIDSGSD